MSEVWHIKFAQGLVPTSALCRYHKWYFAAALTGIKRLQIKVYHTEGFSIFMLTFLLYFMLFNLGLGLIFFFFAYISLHNPCLEYQLMFFFLIPNKQCNWFHKQNKNHFPYNKGAILNQSPFFSFPFHWMVKYLFMVILFHYFVILNVQTFVLSHALLLYCQLNLMCTFWMLKKNSGLF